MIGPEGQEIARELDELREFYESNLMPDSYELLAYVETADGSGGASWAWQAVESNRCKLQPTQRIGTESGANVPIARTDYIARLPLASIATAKHRIVINGREFEITSPPKRGGTNAINLVLEIEERP